MADQIKEGHQVYIICPMVEEGELDGVENVTDYTLKIRSIFPESICIKSLHGKMKNSEKKALDPVYNLRRPPAGQSTAIVHFVSIPSVICLKSAQLLLKYSTLASVRQG